MITIGIKGTVKGQFISAEARSGTLDNGGTWENTSISILQDDDSARINGTKDLLVECANLERFDDVELEVDWFRDSKSGQYKPKAASIRKLTAAEVRPLKNTGT